MSVKTDNVDMVFDIIKIGIMVVIWFILMKAFLEIPKDIIVIFLLLFFIVLDICLIIIILLLICWDVLKLM